MSGSPSEKPKPGDFSAWDGGFKLLDFCMWLQREEVFDMFVEHPELARTPVNKGK